MLGQHVFQVVVCVLSVMQRLWLIKGAFVGKKNFDVIKRHSTTIKKKLSLVQIHSKFYSWTHKT